MNALTGCYNPSFTAEEISIIYFGIFKTHESFPFQSSKRTKTLSTK